MTDDEKSAVGVIFACNQPGDYGLIFPIRHVLSLFGGLDLVAGYGV
jgi:hypothetical protein